MSVESAYERRRKTIAELVFSGFVTGKEAVKFGNTLDLMIEDKRYKFEQAIAGVGTKLAITLEWNRPTILKITVLDLNGQNDANYIIQVAQQLIYRYNKEFYADIKLDSSNVRGKPQPQFIELAFIPKTSTIPSIGG